VTRKGAGHRKKGVDKLSTLWYNKEKRKGMIQNVKAYKDLSIFKKAWNQSSVESKW
jgi:hypothetical protein